MQKEYKGHTITLNEFTGKFQVSINGTTKRFASLKSAENGIDREAVTDFQPTEVLLLEEEGYSPATYKVRRVTLVKYEEEKRYRSRNLSRFFLTDKGDKVFINGYRSSQFYPVSSFEKLTQLAKERTQAEKDEFAAKKRSDKLGEQMEKLATLDLDPRPEVDRRW